MARRRYFLPTAAAVLLWRIGSRQAQDTTFGYMIPTTRSCLRRSRLQESNERFHENQSSAWLRRRFVFRADLQCDPNRAFVLSLTDQENTDLWSRSFLDPTAT